MSDPISDFLTIIRNAYRSGKETCETRYSKLQLRLAQIMQEEGFIRSVDLVDEDKKQKLIITLKYVNETPALTGIKRVSRPGRRMYFQSREIPRTLGGLGIGVLTTSKGLLKDRDARKENVGGEMICAIW